MTKLPTDDSPSKPQPSTHQRIWRWLKGRLHLAPASTEIANLGAAWSQMTPEEKHRYGQPGQMSTGELDKLHGGKPKGSSANDPNVHDEDSP